MTEESKPSVLLIGRGSMGNNHLKNLETLQNAGEISEIYIVDRDETKLPEGYQTSTDLESALKQYTPDIVCVCSNTESHPENIESVISSPQTPAIFVEKPLCDDSKRAEELEKRLTTKGYGSENALGFAYLIRYSRAVDEAIKYVNDNKLEIKSINIQWEKKRGSDRASPGVHIDETTHAIDLVLNYMLPYMNCQVTEVEVDFETKILRNSETMTQGIESMISEGKQSELYGDNEDKLDPSSQVRYKLNLETSTKNTVAVNGFSSFVEGPLNRQIIFQCLSRETGEKYNIEIGFDRDTEDEIKITREDNSILYEGRFRTNRVYDEWTSFLHYYKTGEIDPRLANLESAVFDVKVTEELGQFLKPI